MKEIVFVISIDVKVALAFYNAYGPETLISVGVFIVRMRFFALDILNWMCAVLA